MRGAVVQADVGENSWAAAVAKLRKLTDAEGRTDLSRSVHGRLTRDAATVGGTARIHKSSVHRDELRAVDGNDGVVSLAPLAIAIDTLKCMFCSVVIEHSSTLVAEADNETTCA